jgi:hypothetical protein
MPDSQKSDQPDTAAWYGRLRSIEKSALTLKLTRTTASPPEVGEEADMSAVRGSQKANAD